MENLTTLQALAARISADAITASQPDPQYVAYLEEGNDIGGIDVAFLVKTAEVALGTPRVEVVEVVQELDGTLFVNPDSSTEELHDRPPLRLNAIVHDPQGGSFPVTVIANHLRSLGSANSESAGSNGWPTAGARVRAKRQAQAEDLANLIQGRQVDDSSEHIIVLGDFNAFEVNDGLGHSMGTITGEPAPDAETAVPGDGVDLVEPNLDNLFDSPPPAERYSYVFDGNAQNLDHILINAALDADTLAHRAEHARINADFPETTRNDSTNALRLSDHDPLVAYFSVADFVAADVSIGKAAADAPVTAGSLLSYIVVVGNSGPDPAAEVEWTDTLPTGTTFVSVSEPLGWSCTSPAVGDPGEVACAAGADLPASTSTFFDLVVRIDDDVLPGTVITNTAVVTSATADTDDDDRSAEASVTVGALADLGLLYYTVTPCRVLDTRGGSALGDGGSLVVPVEGACGIPPEARTVAINLTAVEASGNGAVNACGEPGEPVIADVATIARVGRNRANNGVVQLDPSGNVHLWVALDGGGVHALIDVVGYFTEVVPVDEPTPPAE